MKILLISWLLVNFTFGHAYGHPNKLFLGKENVNQQIKGQVLPKSDSRLDNSKTKLANLAKERMARFFMDSASASSASSGNLMDLGLDSNTILTVSFISLFHLS